VTELVGLDPSPPLLARAAARAQRANQPVALLAGVAERLPFDAARFDTVVFTYTLCSVDDPAAALAEARRVLRPDGQLIFVEHGASPHAGLRRWQRRITPVWKRLAGNCHLDRDVPGLLAAAGFAIAAINARRDGRTSLMSFAYSGVATLATHASTTDPSTPSPR
nr:methyltransferase domain-containing protein [Deltaproteobacteria bacterium]